MTSTLEELGKLTPELREKFEDPTATLTALEDLYLPLRPRRRTKASDARKKGLQPLADALLGKPNSPYTAMRFKPVETVAAEAAAEAARTVAANDDGGVGGNGVILSVTEALAGARDIVAEETMEQPDVRSFARYQRWDNLASFPTAHNIHHPSIHHQIQSHQGQAAHRGLSQLQNKGCRKGRQGTVPLAGCHLRHIRRLQFAAPPSPSAPYFSDQQRREGQGARRGRVH